MNKSLPSIASIHVPHTPGPWHVGMNPGPIVYGPQGEQVANMLPCMLERDEHNANARLIAAAPELLALLTRCLDYMVLTSGKHGLLKDQMREAIAKATGQPS